MTYLYNISTEDTFSIVRPCNFISTGTTSRHHYSAAHIPLNYSYFSAYVDGFQTTFEAEDWGAMAIMVPWACTLIELHLQFESVNRDATDDILLTVGKLDASAVSSGTGNDVTISSATTLACAANATSEGYDWGHDYSSTGLNVSFAQNDSFGLFMSKTANNVGYSPYFACTCTMVFKRT